jgi:hypothetical protein
MNSAAGLIEISQAKQKSPGPDAEKSEQLLIAAIGAMIVIQLWFGLISTSFWLDETGTWWIVKDGPAEAIRRAFSWSGQSPLYYLVAWASSRLFGLNEAALRLPSVLAMSGAVFFLYRIAERLFDRGTAAASSFVFLCVASFYAIDARPYALAMFCLTAAMWALLRWLDCNRPLDAILYVIASALVIYAHCIMSLSLAAGVIYAVAVTRKNPRRLAWLGAFQIAIASLCIPLLGELKHFYATRSAHTFTGLPTVGDLLGGFIPCALAGALVLMVWLCMAVRGEADLTQKCTGHTALLVGTWALFAPLFLFLLPMFADLRLFVDRYYSSALAGQALLVGALLSSIRLPIVRKTLLIVLGAVSIFAQGRLTVNSHGNEDWRGAMAFVKNQAGSSPVLVVSPFAEGADFEATQNPDTRDILFSPLLQYGEPARMIRLPHVFVADETAALENLADQLKSQPHFYFLNDKPDHSYEHWLLGRLGSRCKSEPVAQSFGYIWLDRFTCN